MGAAGRSRLCSEVNWRRPPGGVDRTRPDTADQPPAPAAPPQIRDDIVVLRLALAVLENLRSSRSRLVPDTRRNIFTLGNSGS